MQLHHYIYDLLFIHDCVIIPGFGAFILNRTSASIENGGMMIYPPGRIITFNRNIRNNDGLLAGYIASSDNISFPDAANIVRESVAQWNRDLESHHSFELSGIGRFTLSVERKIIFEPDRYAQFSIEEFGLYPVPARPVEKRLPQEKEDRTFISLQPEFSVRHHLKRNLVLSGTAALILCALSVSLFLFNRSWVVEQAMYVASLDYFHTEKASYRDHHGIDFTTPAFPEDTLLIFLNRIATYDSVDLADHEIQSKPLALSANPTAKKQFYVIGGCFKIHENARKFVMKARKKGYEPEIVDRTKNGLFRVCYKKSGSRKDALKILSEVKASLNPDAWILVL